MYDALNPVQREAVMNIDGASLIIAGAGSGKTKVLTCRIARILSEGTDSSSILALTFTNKASKEMRLRVSSLVNYSLAKGLCMGTFHSVFVRFLREYAELLGFPANFSIYDTSDSKSAIKNCVKELNLDDKVYKPNSILSRISKAKNNLITAESYLRNGELLQHDRAAKMPAIGEIYSLYSMKCKKSGAMDFDDILLYMNILLRDFPDVLHTLQSRFSYILVDEYQDTNYAQYLIIKKISAIHRNICVVGDDSQSIYAFRGARIENILNFIKDYPEAKEFRLEQNYRSTKTIVNAANSLIEKNSGRIKKECFSDLEEGSRIEVLSGYNDQEEAYMVVSSLVSKLYSERVEYRDFSILYRTNAQSRLIEEALRKRSIPYKIYGGHSFYDRVEVKDILAYLRLLLNHRDDEAFKRIVNTPARGIGDTTISNLSAAAAVSSLSIWDVIHNVDGVALSIREATRSRLFQFCNMISEISSGINARYAYDVAVDVLIRSGYMDMLKSENTIESQAKLDNIEELLNSIKGYQEEVMAEMGDDGESIVVTLSEFIDSIALMSAVDEDAGREDDNKVNLMTVHSSKGLEFTHVYIIGMEENLFPSVGEFGGESQVEEERRLFYVALTRAKKSVALSYAKSRFRWGTHVNYPVSRFLKEINPMYMDWEDAPSVNLRPLTSFTKPIQTSIADDLSSEPPVVSDLRTGQRVEHSKFGIGTVTSLAGEGVNLKAIVKFDVSGEKVLLLKFAKLKILSV